MTLAAGCNLVLNDWEIAPGPSGGTGAGSSGSTGGAGAVGGGGGNAMVGATPLEAIPLGSDPIADGMGVHREGYFRIEADPTSNWQWARWFYLPDDPEAMTPFGPIYYGDGDTPVYRTTCLWSAVRAHYDDGGSGYSMRSCNYTLTTRESPFVGEPILDQEALPVWFSLFGEVDAVWNAAVTFDTRVFASGRVWTHTHMVNSEPTTGDIEVGFGHIALQAERFYEPKSDEEGLFETKMGNGALLAIDPGSPPGATWNAETIGLRNDGVIGIWELLDTFAVGDVREYAFAFYMGPTVKLRAERAERASDLQNPGVALEGATSLFMQTGGFDLRAGNYVLDKTPGATTVAVVLDNSLARFEPAFEITGWRSSTWAIRLGDETLGDSTSQGPKLLAKHSGDRLRFQYLDVIPAGGARAASTFTISED